TVASRMAASAAGRATVPAVMRGCGPAAPDLEPNGRSSSWPRQRPDVRRSKVVEGEREPGSGVRCPDAVLVGARIAAEDVGQRRGRQLGAQLVVLAAKQPVLVADVEREEGRPPRERRPES